MRNRKNEKGRGCVRKNRRWGKKCSGRNVARHPISPLKGGIYIRRVISALKQQKPSPILLQTKKMLGYVSFYTYCLPFFVLGYTDIVWSSCNIRLENVVTSCFSSYYLLNLRYAVIFREFLLNKARECYLFLLCVQPFVWIYAVNFQSSCNTKLENDTYSFSSQCLALDVRICCHLLFFCDIRRKCLLLLASFHTVFIL